MPERVNQIETLKELYDNYSRMVFNVAYRTLQSKEDAEDVTQDVFLKVYKSLKHFRGEAKISTWLYRVTLNTSLNFQRKRKYKNRLSFEFGSTEDDNEQIDIAIVRNENPDKILERKETEQIVLKAINSLPEQQRIAVILYRYEGLAYEEIAKIMEVSISSVESRLHRAKITLAKKLLPQKRDL